jgi:hypothetical protein
MTWKRVDLHIHTPGSEDYAEEGVSYLDILSKAEEEGLDAIAFTDHNTVAGYAAMQREISDLERWVESGRYQAKDKERLQEYRRLLDKIKVFPGFELTATLGFHILAIFEADTPIRVMEHVLLELNVPPASLDKGLTEVGATADVITAYRAMRIAGALVIAAHANSTHGVATFRYGFGGQTKISYTQDPNLHALEVTDLESRRRRTTASFFDGSKPEYPRRMHCIQGSDAHRVRGVEGDSQKLGVGERATEVLVPDMTVEALIELFESDEFDRSRPYRHEAEPYDHAMAARKSGPSHVQSFHESMTRRGGRLHAVLRDVVAFANTNGGTIYVGLSSNPKAPVAGIDNPEASVAELRKEIDGLVTPSLDVSCSVLKSRGKPVLRLQVPKGDDLPYVLEGSKIYIRQESETNLAMRDEIVGLVRRELKPDLKEIRPSPEPEQRAQQQEPRAKEATPPKPKREEARPIEEPAKERAGAPASGGVEPPHTGVEIAETEERKGVLYHTMRDLRDGHKVGNVTHSSARRLWRYAIALKEKGTFAPEKVKWQGDLGVWHRYRRAGKPHYDLVHRLGSGEHRIYFGVSEEGIHGPWRAVVGNEEP